MVGDFTETDKCISQSIPAGGSCAIQVQFTPSTIGARSGVLTFYANVYGGQLQVELAGTGAESGVVTLLPNPLSFGQVEVGSSLSLSVTAANSATTAIPITSLTTAGPFAIITNSCGTTDLAASADCQIQISFNPTTSGEAEGNAYPGRRSRNAKHSAQLAPVKRLRLILSALLHSSSLQRRLYGLASNSQTVTLTNSGGEPLTAISVAASNGFEVSNGCSTQLAANSSCSLQIEFAPTATGSQSGALTVSDVLRTQTVALSGTGLAPGVLSVSPSSLIFTNQQPGVASPPQTLTVTDTGGAPIANLDIAFTGAAASNYSLGTVKCGVSLAANASCTVQVVFTPSGFGDVAAALNISSSTLGVLPVSVPLNGTGTISSGITVSPSTVTFGVDGMNKSSSAQIVTLTNSTTSAIPSISLAVSGPFSLVTNTCTGSLAPGAGCAASIIFSPTITGPASGTLTITSPALATPITVELIGTGFSFTLSAEATSSQTVAAGQTASYTLEITPSGAQAAFSFACGTLPEYASCTFSPAAETLNSGVQGNVTVNISTGEVSSAKVDPAADWHALPLLSGLLLLPFAFARRRRVLLLVILACILAASAFQPVQAPVAGRAVAAEVGCRPKPRRQEPTPFR